MKQLKSIFWVLFVLIVLLSSSPALAQEAGTTESNGSGETTENGDTATPPGEEESEPETPDPVSIRLRIYAGDTELFNDDITVSACEESPEDDAPLTVNGKCAVEQSGLSSTWTWDYSPSGWMDELEGYATSSDFSKLWNWFDDLSLGQTGLNQHVLSPGEDLLLTYDAYPLRISSSKNSAKVGDTITFTIEELGFEGFNPVWSPSEGATLNIGSQSCTTNADGTCSIVLIEKGTLAAVASKPFKAPAEEDIKISSLSSGGRGGGSSQQVLGAQTKAAFDWNKAISFIMKEQKENGSFGEEMYTDWTILALSSKEAQSYNIGSVAKLIKHLIENNGRGTLLTDHERRAMALMSLGLDPRTTGGFDHIKKITDSFDGAQFGNPNEDNDDIFALLTLMNAGYGKDDAMIKNSLHFILGRQHENGSWDGSIDMTGAAMQALSSFPENEQVKASLAKAKKFLKNTQDKKGGWNDDVSSTSWATLGIVSLGEKPEDWKKGSVPNDETSNTPLDYLATQQGADGGIKGEEINNRVWKTSYALTALSGKTWKDIMHKFEKPKVEAEPNPNALISLPKPNMEFKVAPLPKEKPFSVLSAAPTPKEPKAVLAPKPTPKESVQPMITHVPEVPILSDPSPAPVPDTTQKTNWLKRFLSNIFGFN